jgi:beta-glucosidase
MTDYSRFTSAICLSVICLSVILRAYGQTPPLPYKNSDLPVGERVEDLLSRMTSEEKFWQLYMIPGDLSIGKENLKNGICGLQNRGNAMMNNEIQHFFTEETRLGIPVIFFEEALHGLVLKGATAFPQSIGLAATFDLPLMQDVSHAIAKECRSRGIRQVLSPVVNIASDVRWGRTEETYGEDPFLVSEMGRDFVSGFEKQGVITTPKHFVANAGDGGRDSYPIQYSERALRTIFLPPFEACVKHGGSRSVMSSYNSLDGTPCTANGWLLTDLLKKEWGFGGFVISDAGAVGGANVLHFTATDYADATAQAVRGGLDVILQTSWDQYPLFYEAFQKGMIPTERVDDAVRRVLQAKFSLGLFEEPYVDPEISGEVNNSPSHRELAVKAGRESIVLLKNANNTLPLKQGLARIAVIGPDATEGRLGGYSRPGGEVVTILQGLTREAGISTEVVYSRGCERVTSEVVPVPAEYLFHQENGSLQPGLIGAYFDNISFAGNPVFTRIDPQVKFQWTLYGPDPEKLSYDFYSVRWNGKLVAPETGTFRLGVDGNDGYRLYLDGKLLIDRSIQQTRQLTTHPFPFEKGRAYDLLIEYSEPRGNAWFTVVWDAGLPKDFGWQMEEAIDLAMECDAVIVVAGIEEGEFRDRASLALPGNQEELIRKVAVMGKPVVVVLVGGSAVTMGNWIDSVDAVVDVWYPGEEGGTAVADVLFGKYSPAGRLPVSFPVSEGQLPLVYNHLPTGRGDDYADLTGQPLFPFGFGLSYTSFEYKDLVFDRKEIAVGDTAVIHFTLSNTGGYDGDEVVQVYVRDLVSSVARPVIELKAFQRISLKRGESKEVTVQITPEMLAMLDKDLNEVIEPGEFSIMIGASSRDIRLKGILKVTGK